MILQKHEMTEDQRVEWRRWMRLVRPLTAVHLHAYIRLVLGFDLPRAAMVVGHDAPFEYVKHAFFEDGEPERAKPQAAASPSRDCIVWANRGGGKTQIGAIATLLDLLFKPGIQVRILGGSFDQSSKMYRYLKRMLETEVFSDLIAGSLTGRHVELTNGSRVEVLSQSERAVRGQRVHKLRCDEVELFDAQVWEAAQLTTRSGRCGDVYVHAAIEAMSTMHKPYGLMQKLIREAAAAAGSGGRRVFRWSVLDTLQHCQPKRACESCSLWDECGGRAKLPKAHGFISIDDAIQQKRRVGIETWAAEMLCERPDRSETVYPEFDPKLHVFGDAIDRKANLPQHSAPSSPRRVACGDTQHAPWIGGIDFGYRSPTVVLWARLDDDDVVHVMDELVIREWTAERIIEQAERRSMKLCGRRPEWMGVDPAGHARNEHTGVSTISMWKRAGWKIRTRPMQIEPGIGAVRRRLKFGDGAIGLRVHRRCETLIKSMTMYRYPPNDPEASVPLKDGEDHAADALRYMIVNLDCELAKVDVREY